MFGSTESPSQLVRKRRLLRDLESRLGELVISVPGLAARPEEILPLAALFVEGTVEAERLGETVPQLTPAAAEALRHYAWPKNVRELRNVMVRATVHALGTGAAAIELEHLPKRFRTRGKAGRGRPRKVSREVVLAALAEAKGVQSEAARRLGVHRHSIRNQLRAREGGSPTVQE